MRMRKIVVASLLTVGLVVSMLGVGTTSSAASSPVRGEASLGAPAGVAAPAAGRWHNWDVGWGQTFNNPRNGNKWKIIDKMKNTIRHTRPGWKIRIMTWNLQSRGVVNDLINAHKRGVSVRLIMARELANDQGYHGSFWRLKRGLRTANNHQRKWWQRSWARTCSHSCRGWGGAMHFKFMMVGKAGKRTKIVQQGSANFTQTAATRQWNDWYTVYGKDRIWNIYKRVWKQSLRDRNRAGTIENWQDNHTAWFAPFGNRVDKVMQTLNRVRCKGATINGGTTMIRVAQSVFQNERGRRIARKLRQLHNWGCNVRVVFTMMTNPIRRIIGNVPKRHLVYDWDGDGSFDRYLHMKAMTISGHWNGNRAHRLVLNGSANWSYSGAISDEQGMIIHHRWKEYWYGKHINYLFNSAPRIARAPAESYPDGTNPYRELELELASQG